MSNYDTIIFYCPICKEKNNVQVIHEKAKKAFFQSTNIPAYIAVSIESHWKLYPNQKYQQKINCEKCSKTLVLGFGDIPVRKYNLTVKLDCSNDYTGMEGWYEDQVPNTTDEEYT